MKKSLITILICALLAASLTGCGIVDSIVKVGVSKLKGQKAEQTEEVEDEAEDEAADETEEVQDAQDTSEQEDAAGAEEAEGRDFGDPDEEVEPEEEIWQKLYIRLLNEYREYYLPDADEPANEWTPIQYYLYDVNKDGIPEMIIKRGTCEADYNGEMYSNDGYAAKPFAYDLPLGHTSLYSDPGENGIIFDGGHMGEHWVSKGYMTKDTLEYEEVFGETLMGEDDVYTNMDKIIAGSMPVPYARMTQDLYVHQYDRIWNLVEGKETAAAADPDADKKLKDAVDDTLSGGGSVVGVSADGYGQDFGPVPFDDMLKKLDQWSDVPYAIESQEYADVDLDGVKECVIWVKPESEDATRRDAIVLSLQDGKMYAYIINYVNDATLRADGAFESKEYGYSYRIVFDHDDCMQIYVK